MPGVVPLHRGQLRVAVGSDAAAAAAAQVALQEGHRRPRHQLGGLQRGASGIASLAVAVFVLLGRVIWS